MKVFWVYLGVLVGAGMLLQLLSAGEPRISFGDFRALAEQGALNQVDIRGEVYVGRASPSVPGQGNRVVRTGRIAGSEAGLLELLDARKVPYTRLPDDRPLLPWLGWVLPLAGLGVLLYAYTSRKLSGPTLANPAMSFGKHKARLYVDRGHTVTFRDVAGCEEAKTELSELVDYLRWPERFMRLGGRAPKGVLLVGPPGTGKTLLARAVAGEAKVPFYSVCGSEFVEMFVGVGAARVRDLFAQAQEKPTGIIFIDELDALGKLRGPSGPIGGNDEREQTLNQLLTEMDGFQTHPGLILLAATNRPEILDPALLRPGRFDRRILVDRPDRVERRAILQVHARRVLVSKDVDLEELAAQTPGLVGAELANLVNEAALLAARRRADSVSQGDFDAALERSVAGIERPTRRLSEHEKRLVAYHEAGHGLLAELLPSQDPVRKLSILPRASGALGFTLQQPHGDRSLISRSEILDRLVVLLGGRLAEELVIGDASTGAQDDLLKATELARRMVRELGMGEELGLVALTPPDRALSLSGPEHGDATLQAVDAEVMHLLQRARARGWKLLLDHRDALDRIASKLRLEESLSGTELRALLAQPVPAAPG